ncbi:MULTISPECIES: FadR/GntR family transcriptional regulator [Shinella]|uniref:FadR family transcriptional regulator n=1 Tax=Shinella sedimenti TaxID=2919913 RepID=A0ABT0CTX6_9HYPH|nr:MULTISPECIES: FadR/GntR family transcriptional regulator [Shinella]MCJ8152055.1 FadR family transcriptional regulator [Shinella sedimenti]
MSSLPLSPLHETIHKQTAKEMIRDKIVSMIASGILQRGDELPSERELSTMLAVSRETVRGAVQLLAGEGVVQVSQGARTRVARVDVTVGAQRIGVTNPTSINGYSLDAVHAARLLVETAVAADAARHLSEDDIQRLENSIAAQEEALNDPVRFLICDREFHLTIYYASTNRLLADFVVDLYTYMLDHRRIAMAEPGAIEKSLEDHRFIVRALKMRNPDAVAAAFSEHILRIHDTSRAVGESTHGTATRPPADPVSFKTAGRL